MNNRLRRAFLAFASVALLGLAALPAGASHLESIAAARHEALGASVTVRGTVTVPSGAFDPGFAIQQGSSGIYVLDAGGADRHVGDVVTVSGTLVDNFGLLSIQPGSVTANPAGAKIHAHEEATGDVGEATEGRLLHLEGKMVSPLFDDSPYGFKFNIDDGSGPIQIFLYPGTGISTAGLHVGAEIELDCFSNQFDTDYECDPPNASSFHVEH
jgi:hypothetical protein